MGPNETPTSIAPSLVPFGKIRHPDLRTCRLVNPQKIARKWADVANI
jgi:hypothetical protein